MIEELEQLIEDRFLWDFNRVLESLDDLEIALYNKIFEGIEEDLDDVQL